MLNVHGKQLRSCWDGQLLNHSLLEAVYQYLVPILSPVTDIMLFLNQRKRVISFSMKNVLEVRIDGMTAACKADTLPIELSRPVLMIIRISSSLHAVLFSIDNFCFWRTDKIILQQSSSTHLVCSLPLVLPRLMK